MSKISKQDSESSQTGLVISWFGSSVAVEVEDGQVFQCHLRRNQELPVVGDHVHFSANTVTDILPRHSLLSRGDGHGKTKNIAANIDSIFIVMSPPPVFSEYLIDRYLVAAELLKIEPVIVLNKTDLLDDKTGNDIRERLKPYQDVPYPVVLSSIYTDNGFDSMLSHIDEKKAVLVGPSGVGKSSIIAALGNHHAIPVGEVSAKGAGKHTTTATRLYHLPGGGQLIDSPGVREFNLWQVSQQEVLKGFREFQPFLNNCKFRDCHHLVEPGCEVLAAVENGKISKKRYESYQKLMKEAASYKKY